LSDTKGLITKKEDWALALKKVRTTDFKMIIPKINNIKNPSSHNLILSFSVFFVPSLRTLWLIFNYPIIKNSFL